MTFFRVAAVGLMSTFFITNHAFSQTRKAVPARPSTPARSAATRPATSAGPKATLTNSNDSLSYSIGYSIAQSLKQQRLNDVNTSILAQAINDALKGQKLAIDEGQMQQIMMGYMQKQQMSRMAEQSKAAEGNKKMGAAFLAENKSKPGVQTTASGLQYKIEKEGTGPKPTATDRVKVHYTGTLLDGKVFDSSVQRGEPAEFGVTEVIKGWTEVLQLMPVGSKWKVFIPSDIAYGDRGAGSDIGPGSTLVFDIELLDIVKTN
ncbi:Peptidylprolyl isomerase [Fibrella aestuarina BUZ 2]|uniref:Peptidyl-prolyl cis-trans isomerase n=1 Tax=Fibrella aestuarina BUZ 2 TaxID=1166018 RepID=I0K5A9_9BACT|nr:FKBP-type peptidyl-prolyl cis-trans isomerase [Fibrella aestuarina]CCG99312.1 Peptidylprolyl isomerase [Fibrella aestuarina BUZ 2]